MVSAESILKHALEPLLALLRFGEGHLAHFFVYAGTKPLGTNAASPNNVGKSPLSTAHAARSLAGLVVGLQNRILRCG